MYTKLTRHVRLSLHYVWMQACSEYAQPVMPTIWHSSCDTGPLRLHRLVFPYPLPSAEVWKLVTEERPTHLRLPETAREWRGMLAMRHKSDLSIGSVVQMVMHGQLVVP